MPTAAGLANLQPFEKGSERAKEAGRKSVEARRARKELARAESEGVAQHLATLTTYFERDQLGPTAAAVAMEVLGRLSRGEIPIRHAADAAELVNVLVTVARLEAGESTSNAVVAHVSPDAVAARISQLQQQAREALASPSAAVLAAADVVVVDAPSVVVEAQAETTPSPG